VLGANQTFEHKDEHEHDLVAAVNFVLQREVFIHFDEDSRPRGDKIIHNKVAKPRRENISQQGHKGRKDSPFEFLKSVFVAFAILL
jgi:hypothetical protein